jgi:hypothetical protein
MKLKYIFASIVATLALAVGCQKEAGHYLKEIQVSSSYLGFPAEGGSVDVTVTATQDWSINAIPEWITATPANGSAGVTTVKFTAMAAESTREVSFSITSGNVKQTINAIQVTEAVEPTIISVAEAIKMIQADQSLEQTIYVKGIVCQIDEISPSYGNATYYISDDGSKTGTYGSDGKGDGNWLEIYRGAWLNGAKFTKGDEFSVGDEMVVCGVLMSYKGTPETKEKTAYVVSFTKSLIGIDSTELLNVEEGAGVTEYPKDGGAIKVNLTLKNSGFHVSIPAEAKSWLHIEDFGPEFVTLAADANAGGDREVTVTFSTESAGKTYTCQQKLTQKGAIQEVSIADFLAAPVSSAQYRLTGTITKVANTAYGNVYIKDFSGEVYVYGIGSKGDFEALGLKEGDIVTIVGQRGEHSGTAQVAKAIYESHIPVTTVTVAEFLAAAESKDVWYRITGVVEKPTEEGTKWDIEKYGNLNVKDESGSVYVYGVSTGVKGQTQKFGTLGVQEGDNLTIIGYRTSYKGLNQVGGAMYVSHIPANAE